MYKKIFLKCLLGFILLAPLDLYSELMQPLNDKNMFILYVAHLYMPVVSSSVEKDKSKIDTGFYVANTHFAEKIFAVYDKQGIFDVETYAFTVNYYKQILENTAVMLFVPYYYHGGGFLDPLIQGYHGLFPSGPGGLPNGGREFSSDKQIHIQYEKNNGGPDINSSIYGFGDPSVYVKYTFFSDSFGLAMLAGIKPLIGHKVFINSNTTDTGVTLNADYRRHSLYFFSMTGVSYFMGKGYYKQVFSQNKDYIIPFAAGIGWNVTPTLALITQFYCHTSLFNTGVGRIDLPTVCNSYGLRWLAGRGCIVQFSFIQDSITLATTDISFNVRMEYCY
jgi:hypothetical protein